MYQIRSLSLFNVGVDWINKYSDGVFSGGDEVEDVGFNSGFSL